MKPPVVATFLAMEEGNDLLLYRGIKSFGLR